MTNAQVTVERLAELKRLPPDALRRFGLSDATEGVRFAYRAVDGTAGRTRLRTGVRGVGGSSWLPGDDAPVVAYSDPVALRRAAELGYQIVVEGESDCWTAWEHGLPAVGIPGSAHWDALTLGHLPVAEVFVQVEADSAETYPNGVADYVRAVVDRIRSVGFTGRVHRLELGAHSDLSELHCAGTGDFEAEVGRALERSRAAGEGEDA